MWCQIMPSHFWISFNNTYIINIHLNYNLHLLLKLALEFLVFNVFGYTHYSCRSHNSMPFNLIIVIKRSNWIWSRNSMTSNSRIYLEWTKKFTLQKRQKFRRRNTTFVALKPALIVIRYEIRSNYPNVIDYWLTSIDWLRNYTFWYTVDSRNS